METVHVIKLGAIFFKLALLLFQFFRKLFFELYFVEGFLLYLRFTLLF
jgi:hypothetical protein